MTIEVYREFRRDVGSGLFVVGLVLWLLYVSGSNRDDTDPPNGPRSGLVLRIDHGTGLHYLEGGGCIIPRMDPNGRHMRTERRNDEAASVSNTDRGTVDGPSIRRK